MSKVLYIKANPKSDEMSNTFQLANVFVSEYKQLNPHDDYTELDLYKENIKLLDGEMLRKMFAREQNIMMEYANQFATHDKYIIASPMWNLSIPAILKAYIDYIAYVGITFKYTENGSVGLLTNKKAIHIVTRGGSYENSDIEFGDKYLRGLLGFFGVKDFRTLNLDNTNVLMGLDLEKAKNAAFEKAKLMAKEF